jgi:hypothetical protein
MVNLWYLYAPPSSHFAHTYCMPLKDFGTSKAPNAPMLLFSLVQLAHTPVCLAAAGYCYSNVLLGGTAAAFALPLLRLPEYVHDVVAVVVAGCLQCHCCF